MARRLVNVRLDAEHARKARRLREQGIALSDVVREAIDARYAETEARPTPLGARALARRIFDDHPDPAGLPARGYDVHDGRAARQAIRGRLRARRKP